MTPTDCSAEIEAVVHLAVRTKPESVQHGLIFGWLCGENYGITFRHSIDFFSQFVLTSGQRQQLIFITLLLTPGHTPGLLPNYFFILFGHIPPIGKFLPPSYPHRKPQAWELIISNDFNY